MFVDTGRAVADPEPGQSLESRSTTTLHQFVVEAVRVGPRRPLEPVQLQVELLRHIKQNVPMTQHLVPPRLGKPSSPTERRAIERQKSQLRHGRLRPKFFPVRRNKTRGLGATTSKSQKTSEARLLPRTNPDTPEANAFLDRQERLDVVGRHRHLDLEAKLTPEITVNRDVDACIRPSQCAHSPRLHPHRAAHRLRQLEAARTERRLRQPRRI